VGFHLEEPRYVLKEGGIIDIIKDNTEYMIFNLQFGTHTGGYAKFKNVPIFKKPRIRVVTK
jgi:hypothetical protein